MVRQGQVFLLPWKGLFAAGHNTVVIIAAQKETATFRHTAKSLHSSLLGAGTQIWSPKKVSGRGGGWWMRQTSSERFGKFGDFWQHPPVPTKSVLGITDWVLHLFCVTMTARSIFKVHIPVNIFPLSTHDFTHLQCISILIRLIITSIYTVSGMQNCRSFRM